MKYKKIVRRIDKVELNLTKSYYRQDVVGTDAIKDSNQIDERNPKWKVKHLKRTITAIEEIIKRLEDRYLKDKDKDKVKFKNYPVNREGYGENLTSALIIKKETFESTEGKQKNKYGEILPESKYKCFTPMELYGIIGMSNHCIKEVSENKPNRYLSNQGIVTAEHIVTGCKDYIKKWEQEEEKENKKILW